ncbi:hypothetical protein B296_00009019 [Ensete ventricosum]|uniref:SGNH hydrolase-type esterase domain-containing protein n=1 Tax=Ensete ventricosum TaxID=4639 RepID=A0A426YYQ5_ENSVE|nr:hypothetical protein B296_00009019 [Ensete ventricosum]
MEGRKMKLSTALIMLLLFGVSNQRCSCAIVQFIFGDSLSDVGNNNYLTRSLARAALPWRQAGPPAAAGVLRPVSGRGHDTQQRINYPRVCNFFPRRVHADGDLASSGVLLQVQRFSLYKQIELFQGTQELIRRKIGRAAADDFFAQARYVVALGSNDFINNYLLPVYSDSWSYDGETFIDYLMSTLEGQLKLLHSLGARQLTFFGLGPMGCIPLQRILTSSGGCQESTNKLALGFNKAATELLGNLSNTLPNATYRFGDAYDSFQDLIDRPYMYGFNNSRGPCCSLGRIRPTLTCTPLSTLCEDRSQYVFWDEYHPTDQANELIANEIITKLGFKPINETNTP